MHLDQEIFSALYEAHFRRVYNYICYRINNHGDVEDLVSQVFMRAIEKYDSFDPKRGCLEGWIIGIARNAVIDYYRDRGKYAALDLETLRDAGRGKSDGLDEIVVRSEEHQSLMNALNILSPRERQLVALKYGAELGNKEIARHMSLSISNVGVLLFRSLRKLRAVLNKEVRL